MFDTKQRDKIRAALEARAASAKPADARKLRRVAGESRLFDRFIERKARELRKAKPGAPDGTILKMLLDWISNGGLDQILKFVMAIIGMFS